MIFSASFLHSEYSGLKSKKLKIPAADSFVTVATSSPISFSKDAGIACNQPLIGVQVVDKLDTESSNWDTLILVREYS